LLNSQTLKSSNRTQYLRITSPINGKNEFDQSESYGIFFYYFQQEELERKKQEKKSKHVSISHEIYQEIQKNVSIIFK